MPMRILLRPLAALLPLLFAGGAPLWADEPAAAARRGNPTQEHVEDAQVGEEFGFVFAVDLGTAPETTWVEVLPETTVSGSRPAASEQAEGVTGGEVEVHVEQEAEPGDPGDPGDEVAIEDETAIEDESAVEGEVADSGEVFDEATVAADDLAASEGEEGEEALETEASEGTDEVPAEEIATTADEPTEPDAPPATSAAGPAAGSR